jgi:hypothetical protein
LRTRACGPSTRRSAEPARGPATRSVRTRAGTDGSGRVDTPRTARSPGVHRPHSAPGRAARAHAHHEGTRRAATTSRRLRVRWATPRAARAGRPGLEPGRRAS